MPLQAHVVAAAETIKQNEAAEQERLVALVNQQALTLDALKSQLYNVSRKGV